jgi:hypothetical protein
MERIHDQWEYGARAGLALERKVRRSRCVEQAQVRKGPKTGRRVTRTNPESDWIIQEVPELRILDDKLFDAARARRLGNASFATAAEIDASVIWLASLW